MDDLAPAIRDAQQQAAGICTDCLRDAIAVETANLDEATAYLETVTAAGKNSPDRERAYAELVATLITISVLTAELTRRPPVVQVPLSTLN